MKHENVGTVRRREGDGEKTGGEEESWGEFIQV